MTEKINKIIDENPELKDYISSLDTDNKSLETKVNNLETVLAERDAEINLLKEAM